MSDEDLVFPKRYKHAGLTDEDAAKLMSFMRPRRFEAGSLIAQPGRPVTGIYCVQRGVIAVSDDVQVDLGRRGILLERGDTFGEYSLMDKIRALPEPERKEGEPAAAPDPYRHYAAEKEVRPFPSGLRALTDVETLYLPADQYAGAAAALKTDVVKLVVQRVFLNEHVPDLVDALKRQPKVRTVASYQLIDLAQRGQAIALERGKDLRDEMARAGGQLDSKDWFYLARGELTVDTNAVMFPGSVFRCKEGGRYVSAGEQRDDTETRGPSWIVRISKDDLKEFSNHSFLITSCSWNPDKEDDQERRKRQEPPPGKTILLVTDRHRRTHPTPLSALSTMLANTLQRELPKTGNARRDTVGLLVVRPKDRDAKHLESARNEAIAVGVRVEVMPESEDLEPIKRKLAELQATTNPVVLDVEQGWMARQLNTDHAPDELRPSKLVFLAHDPFAKVPPPFDDCQSIVRCVLLRQSAVGGYLPYYPRTVRLAFDDLERLEATEYRKLPDRDLASISRLGRAITERRVGVALGGGGAWGFAHIALLQELHRVEMPVDIVSGVSFGSLAGGFFAAGGLPVLQEVMNKRQMLQWTLLAGSWVPPVVEWYLDSLLEAQRLEYLETAFLPVGLNLNTGEEWSPGIGSVASGIRAASSLPGFFSPFLAKGVRSVDGVYINNVPEGILTREGADFIISSDVAETPKVPEQKEGLWRHVWNWLPISRMQDNMRALAFATKVADDRDKGMSNAQFRPQQAGVPPWDFSKGHLIKTNAENGAARFADEVRKQWATEWMRV